jgi:EmrB/QacA subfamily drug resistance transporter
MAEVTYASAPGRWVLLATVLGSAMASLDATVVNVALPVIGRDLHAGVSGLQWIVTGYMLTLAALLLMGGSLGDHLGRRRVFVAGVVWFAVASVLCALAPTLAVLLIARALQGVGGALLTPGSLAIIQASFRQEDRGRAIGAWSGFSGIATAIGPFLGGWLIVNLSWRWIFLLNVPLSVVVVAIAVRHVPESSDPAAARQLDPVGALLTVVGLGLVTYALIERNPLAGVIGIVALAAFVQVQRRSDHAMLPIDIFRSRQFTGANVMTFLLYGALSGAFFLLAIALQGAFHYSPTAAGAAFIPLTGLMLVFSPRAGALAQRVGPRLPMTVGPLVAALGLALFVTVNPGDHYLTSILPAILVFGAGLSLTVAPLTATVLAAADNAHAGIASAVNNTVARVAGLLAVATLPAVVGLHGKDFERPAALAHGLHVGMVIAAVLAAISGVLSWITIRREQPVSRQLVGERHCPLDAPPLRPASHCEAAGSRA